MYRANLKGEHGHGYRKDYKSGYHCYTVAVGLEPALHEGEHPSKQCAEGYGQNNLKQRLEYY